MLNRPPSLPIVCPHCRRVTEIPEAKLRRGKVSTCRFCGKTSELTQQVRDFLGDED